MSSTHFRFYARTSAHVFVLEQVKDWSCHKSFCRQAQVVASQRQQNPTEQDFAEDFEEWLKQVNDALYIAIRSAFKFGQADCDELRRSSFLYVCLTWDPTKETARSRLACTHSCVMNLERAFEIHDQNIGGKAALLPRTQLEQIRAKKATPILGSYHEDVVRVEILVLALFAHHASGQTWCRAKSESSRAFTSLRYASHVC